MKQKSQVVGNVPSSDQINNGIASSCDENKPNIQSQRDTEVSTLSLDRVQSVQQTSIRSDTSSEIDQPFTKHAKHQVSDTTEEISQENSTVKVPWIHEQRKIESSSSKESGESVPLSSVDSADPKPCKFTSDNLVQKSHNRLNVCGYSHSTQSTESKNLQKRDSSRHDLNSSVHYANVSEPINVVAKVGVPLGQPKKPLEFRGEHGWRYGNTSAFQPTSFREKGGCRIFSDCGSKQSPLISQGIDLNVPATMDSEVPAEEISTAACSKHPKRFIFDVNCQENHENYYKQPGASSFEFNSHPKTENTSKVITQPGKIQQLSRNHVPVETAACRVPSYWVDLSSARSFSQSHANPLLVAAPIGAPVTMMVPIQSEVSFASSGLYKISNLSPTFFPHTILPHVSVQHGSTIIPGIPGPVLAAYHGAVHAQEVPQAVNLNPHSYANLRPTFVQNNGVVPIDNTLYEERMQSIEQATFPTVHAKRREPDGGWESSQVHYRRIRPWI